MTNELDLKQEGLQARAMAFAIKAHEGQRRKGEIGVPFVLHPLDTANLLARAGVEDDGVIAAALLHDVLEDTDTPFGALVDEFGPRVARIVNEVTWKAASKSDKIKDAPDLSLYATLVKTADLLSNVNSIIEEPSALGYDKAKAYVAYALAMLAAFNTFGDKALVILKKKLRSACLEALKAIDDSKNLAVSNLTLVD